MASFFFGALLLLLLPVSSFFFNPKETEAAIPSQLITSIDCGASNSYDDNLGIPWSDDTTLINSGEPRTVVSNDASISQPMKTLRVFPTGERNCYDLQVPNGQVLVRASFFYGNYDEKNSPPTFDLEFDGNRWATVEATSDTVVSQEAIYAVSNASTSVCVVQTKSGDLPFLSAIEVRGLDDAMYSHYNRESSALVLTKRTAAGLTKTVRYPDDPYDRMWLPFDLPNAVVQNQATTITSAINDHPPEAVFRSALIPTPSFVIVNLFAPRATDTVNVYVNLYFTEVAQLAAGENRTFQVLVNNKTVSDPLVLSFGSVTEFHYANSLANNVVIQLQRTANSTLPPVISAVEAYILIPLATGGGSIPSGDGRKAKAGGFVELGVGIIVLSLFLKFKV